MRRLLIATTLVCASALAAQAGTTVQPSGIDGGRSLDQFARQLQSGGISTDWARMTRRQMRRQRMMRNGRTNRRTMRRNGAGSASPSAPNGRNFGLGPTGQPSGVK